MNRTPKTPTETAVATLTLLRTPTATGNLYRVRLDTPMFGEPVHYTRVAPGEWRTALGMSAETVTAFGEAMVIAHEAI